MTTTTTTMALAAGARRNNNLDDGGYHQNGGGGIDESNGEGSRQGQNGQDEEVPLLSKAEKNKNMKNGGGDGDHHYRQSGFSFQRQCSCCSQSPSQTQLGCRHFQAASDLWTTLVFGWFEPVLQSMQHSLDNGVSPDLDSSDFSDDDTDDDETGDRSHVGSDPGPGPGAIPPLPSDKRCRFVSNRFEQMWEQELLSSIHPNNTTGDGHGDGRTDDGRPSLTRCLWRSFSPLFLKAGCLKAVHDCLQFVGPKVLNGLIVFLREDPVGDENENGNGKGNDISVGLYLTFAVTIAQLGMSLCLRHYFFMCYRVGIKIRTAILMAIYKKALKIDSTYYKKHPVGQVTNLMSVDVQRIQDVISFLHAIWYSFLQIILAMYFLWQQLGPSCLAGVLIIILSIPLTAITASWMGKLQKRLMEAKDERVDVNQETVANMKVVKLQAWETPFKAKINKLRSYELWRLFLYDIGQSCTQLLWSSVPLIIALTTFGAYVAIAGKVGALLFCIFTCVGVWVLCLAFLFDSIRCSSFVERWMKISISKIAQYLLWRHEK